MSEMVNNEMQEKRTVEMVTLEIRTLDRQAKQMVLGYAIEIGRRLVEVKAMLPHGAWGEYLKTQVQYAQSTANNFMKIFEEYGADQQSLFGPEAKSQALGNLPYTKALRLLALPAEEREEFVESNDVEHMSTRQLEAAIRAKEEAEKEAKLAEQARQKMEEDMALANQRLKDLGEEKEATEKAAVQAERDKEQAEERVRALEAEMEELRIRPVDVAVAQPTQEMMDELREECAREARMLADQELQKAKADLAAARDKEKEAMDKLKEMKERVTQAEKSAKEARDASERAQKEARMAADKDMAAFQILFEQTQQNVNKMADILKGMDNSGKGEIADKLRRAMGAMSQAIAAAAGK